MTDLLHKLSATLHHATDSLLGRDHHDPTDSSNSSQTDQSINQSNDDEKQQLHVQVCDLLHDRQNQLADQVTSQLEHDSATKEDESTHDVTKEEKVESNATSTPKQQQTSTKEPKTPKQPRKLKEPKEPKKQRQKKVKSEDHPLSQSLSQTLDRQNLKPSDYPMDQIYPTCFNDPIEQPISAYVLAWSQSYNDAIYMCSVNNPPQMMLPTSLENQVVQNAPSMMQNMDPSMMQNFNQQMMPNTNQQMMPNLNQPMLPNLNQPMMRQPMMRQPMMPNMNQQMMQHMHQVDNSGMVH